MAEETEISTPEVETVETTSSDEVETTTSNDEITNSENTAETEGVNEGENNTTPPISSQGELYAGKYKTVEELVKGYNELQKSYTQGQQIQSKYNELLKQQKAEQDKQLANAKELGFNTVQDKEISDRVNNYEYQKYANALNYLPQEYQKEVFDYLNSYAQTGDKRYLEAAKAYYSSTFVEQTAREAFGFESQLKQQYELRSQKEKQEQEAALFNSLKADWGEWAQSMQECKPAQDALNMFYNAGFIQSTEDMKVFTEICDGIMKFASEKAVKEYEANKAIEATKKAASIDGGTVTDVDMSTMPTLEQLEKMTPAEYDKAVNKYGLEKLFNQK